MSVDAKTIYLNTGGSGLWNQGGAKFGCWTWGSSDKGDFMTHVEGDVWAYETLDANNNVKFTRVSSSCTGIWGDGGQKWNETGDLSIPEGKNCYTITGWGGTDGSWSTYTPDAPKTYKDITFTITANAAPQIHYWNGGDKMVGSDWENLPTMTATGNANEYTYTVKDVDEAKGVEYLLKIGNIQTPDKTTSENVIADFKDLMPEVYVKGVTGWTGDGHKMTIADDYASASVTITLAANLTADLKLTIGGTWMGDTKNAITKENNSSVFDTNGQNGSIKTDIAGDYVFTYTYADQTLTVTYPTEEIEVAVDCYVTGNTALTGEDWVLDSENLKMTKVEGTEKYTYTFTALPANTAFELKVVYAGSQKGFSSLSEAIDGVTANGDNICFTLEETGDVTVTYDAETEKIALTGNFSIPVTYDYYIAGNEALLGVDKNWGSTPAGKGMDKGADGLYTATFTLSANTEYEFKITDGQWNSEGDNSHEHTTLAAVYVGVTGGNGNNIIVNLAEAKELVITFNATEDKIYLNLDEETASLTYRVQVPEGTEACYIAGPCGDWSFREMTREGETDIFTIDIVGAKETDEYKYACQANWAYAEVIEGGGNRTEWQELDQVEEWGKPAETHTYTVAGFSALCGSEWDAEDPNNEMTLQDDGTYVWTATGVSLSESVKFKIVEDHNWDIAWPASDYVIEIGEDKENTPGTYDVNIYFNAAEAKADNTTGIYVVLTPATIEIAEYYDITMTDLQTEDYGGILALMGSETDVLGLSVMLFLNDYTGEDKEYQLNEASYLAMVSGWMETELPFVSGSMTKSTDATYGDKFAGTVIVSMDDRYYGLNITMYKKPLPKVDLTITGADVAIDLYNGVKITTTHDGKPVLVEFSSFEYLASNKYYDAAFEMGDWETDDTYFRAFATEADVTISGNTLTLKGSFEAADAIYNLTISGAMPLVVTEGDNTNLLAQNGQTADAYITRTFESGNLYTVSFPFAMNETTTKNVFGSRVEVYEYTSLTEETDGLVLNFTKLSTPQIAAGTPYLVKPNKESYGFGMANVAISSTTVPVGYTTAGTTITMEPVLTVAAEATTNGKTQYWLAEDNNLYNKSVNLKGLRAIFNVQTNKSNVRARAAFNENVETGVEDIFSTDAPVKVIENGQLIIIRDGVKYNVQGQKL